MPPSGGRFLISLTQLSSRSFFLEINFRNLKKTTNFILQARASYSRTHSDPVSRCTSAQSPGPPLPMMFTGPDPFLMPVQSATFIKTTAAKKISTNEFRPGEFEEMMLGAGGQGRSLKYDSIVNSQQMPASSQSQLPPDNAVTSSNLQSGSDNLTSSPQLQPSPYVYRHRQDENFVTHLNTEDFVTPTSWRPSSSTPARTDVSLTAALSALSVSDHSQYPEQQQVTMSTFQRPEDVSRGQRGQDQDRGHQQPLQPPSYKPPPPQSSLRPPQLQKEPAIGKEDIKVIHFGVV